MIYHSDPAINREIIADKRAADEVDFAAGLPPNCHWCKDGWPVVISSVNDQAWVHPGVVGAGRCVCEAPAWHALKRQEKP